MNITQQVNKESLPVNKEPLLKNDWLVPLIAVLVSYPVWAVLTTSPINLAIPVLLAAFWILIRQKQFFVAGIVAGLCVFKIEYLPMLVASGFILGRLRFLAGIALILLAVFGVPQLNQLKDSIDLAAMLVPATTQAPNLMQNISGFIVLLLGGDSPELRMASLAIYAVFTIAVTELWWRLHKFPISQIKYLKLSAVSVLYMLIGSPHTFTQDYIALIPVVVWLWQATAGDTRDNSKNIRKMIVAFPVLSWIFFFAEPVFLFLRLPPFFIWATTLAVFTLPTLEDPKTESSG